MGFLTNAAKLFRLLGGRGRRRRSRPYADTARRCRFEAMEPRQLLDAAPLYVGAVYVEEDQGSDLHGDTFALTFVGGAPATELTRVAINGDQNTPGLSVGDMLFDTVEAGRGADHAFAFQLVSLQTRDPLAAVAAQVEDGSSLLVLTLTRFQAGDKLVFTIDVDEVQHLEPGTADLETINDGLDPIASGVEFQGSAFSVSFSAPHYYDAEGNADFLNRYDPLLQDTGLALPADDAGGKRDRTAGVAVHLQQQPLPVAIAGTVYLETDLDLVREAGEPGLAGVTLELWRHDGTTYQPTGHRTTTGSDGRYAFGRDLHLLPGIYQVRETQPAELFSVGAIPGTVAGQPVGRTVAGDPDVLAEIAIPLGDLDAIDYDFAEALPARLSGYVYHDRDQDGHRDAGEEGLAGVPIRAVPIQTIAAQGPVSIATDANGFYAATGLAPGTYQVLEVAQPDGYLDGLDAAGTVDGEPRGTAVNPGDRIESVWLGGGQAGQEYNFGELLPVSIAGHVRLSDRDGTCTATGVSDTPVAGATVRLLDSAGQVLAETVTDARGEYHFAGLHPGVYGIVEVTPSHLLDGPDHVGRVAGQPMGTVTANDTITGIALTSGQAGVDYDFCEHLPAALSGYVYHDRDDDGQRETGEEGLGGVTVTLLDDQGQTVAATTTDAQGAYTFSRLSAGVYAVVETQPETWVDGRDTAGTIDGATVGQADNPGDRIRAVALRWGEQGRDYNFGELKYASLAGSVHLSGPEGDCWRPGGDQPPLAGVTVVLRDEGGLPLATTTTDEQGHYRFDPLPPGTYTVVEFTPEQLLDGPEYVGSVDGVPVGYVAANDTIQEITLASGQAGEDYDFCEHLPAALSGFVYHDRNDNGVLEPGEEPIAGVTLTLLDGGGEVVATASSLPDGSYQFAGLAADEYRVRETQPAGYLDGRDAAGTVAGQVVGTAANPGDEIRAIRLRWGDQGVHYDFGELRTGSIEGFVHTDFDLDCTCDENESPLADVTLELLDAAGQVLATTRTDGSGHYRFDHLVPGTYTVREQQPAGYFHGGQQAGSGGGDDRLEDIISAIAVGSGQRLIDYNFCERPPGRLSGYVFQDGETLVTLDGQPPADLRPVRDGRRTPDDKPLAGVRLELRDGVSGDPLTGDRALPGTYGPGPLTTVTDANGFYEFRGLPRGNYAVYQIQPDGYFDGIDTPGTTSGLAINPSDDINPLLIQRLSTNPHNDAIILIPLAIGVSSEHNNFSEVAVRRGGYDIPPPPRKTPPPPAPAPLAVPPPAAPPVIFVPPPSPPQTIATFGAGGMVDFTWHLSVIDAGKPRGQRAGVPLEGLVLRAATAADPGRWYARGLHEGEWILRTGNGTPPGTAADDRHIVFGIHDGIPVVGDWNGDGVDELGLFYKGRWFVDLNGNGRWDEDDLWAQLGDEFDSPVSGDWNGDGKDDLGIYGPAWEQDARALQVEPGLPDLRNGTVPLLKPKNMPPKPDEATSGLRLMKHTAQGGMQAHMIDHVFQYGTHAQIPLTGDWNGDGIQNIGVFHEGHWRLDVDGDGHYTDRDRMLEFGRPGDLPVVGDFDGDGVDEIGVFRDGQWLIDSDGNGRHDAHDRVFALGEAGDVPVVGDWDGDGSDDPGVYREVRAPAARQARQAPPAADDTVQE